MDVRKERGKRLKQVRLKFGLTVTEMADEMYVSKVHLRNLEAGRKSATLEFYSMLEQKFGVSLNYMINGKEMSDEDIAELKRLIRLMKEIEEKKVG